MKIDLKILIQNVVATDSPDLHLQVGQPPVIRLKTGELSVFKDVEAITPEDMQRIISEVSNEDQRKKLDQNFQVDFSYSLDGVSRFRVNFFYEQNGPSASFRLITGHVPTLEEIGLGGGIAEALAMSPNGLVLVTGATGTGKSTTLAALVNYISENRSVHIITVEDPIEYIYKSKRSLITQRELNAHTKSFSEAIKGALRQDPDVVMVGEMRDLETIAAAITLAETGHLVLSTLHTRNAAQTIDRIIDVFPAYQQQQIRIQLSSSLKGVISQKLIPRADGQGRVAGREIMIVNDAVKNCIANAETKQINSIIQIGGSEGMILMDDSLENLYRSGFITKKDALAQAQDPQMLAARIEMDE